MLPIASALGPTPAAADAITDVASAPRAVLAFLPAARASVGATTPVSVLDTLGSRARLALGLSSAAQGGYDQEQALLDITQGTRTSSAAYDPRVPAPLTFIPSEGGGATMLGWSDVLARAASAPAEIHPATLGARVPGGVAYVGVLGKLHPEAAVAVDDSQGRIVSISIGHSSQLRRRVREQLAGYRLVVVGLPSGVRGAGAVDGLIADRRPQDLLLITQTPPAARAPQLLPIAAVGLGPPGSLTSASTHQDGLVAGIDVLPTIFRHLHIPIPTDVKGQPFRVRGSRDRSGLMALSSRLQVISGRRFPALEVLLSTWLGVLLVGGVIADRRGVQWAMRVGGLAFCWLLGVLLVTAALAPARTAELVLITVLSFGLGILTDALCRWPRAIFVPCAVTILAYTIDLARHSELIARSLLGPNPRFGSRFYGLGNELEASLCVLLLVAVAAVLHGRERSRSGAALFGVSGAMFAAVAGSGRLGADVGGVITIATGSSVAVLAMLPGGMTRRAIALAVAAPIVGLGSLAALDVVTGGDGHFTRTILHADSVQALADVATRRYELAYHVLQRGLMPFATGIALLSASYAIRHRERVYANVLDQPAWQAALVGSLAAAVVGSLSNDSGPVLLLVGTFVLAAVSAYLRGEPHHDRS